MVAIVHFNPQTHVGGGRVHVTESWIFASEDIAHDCDFHLHGVARMADHYLRGDGSEATAAARKEGRTPRIHMFTDGCGKQYKGRRNFRFLTDSVRQIGFFIDHHFAATSHFKDCHDGIGGVAKNAMNRRERFGKRIMGADGGGYFAKWSPYRMRRVHVEFIGKKEIYRPNSIPEGVEGTREMYHFAGANTPKWDRSTSTKGREDDCKLVLKSEGQGQLSSLEEPVAGSQGAGCSSEQMEGSGGWVASSDIGGGRRDLQEGGTDLQSQDSFGVVLLLGVPVF
ncbi:unnamed protein product [Ectocarpus sp. CCAP 1310/34]|nr:unnamed protein product [Ectocarpus sp. CCAP 1310/34]